MKNIWLSSVVVVVAFFLSGCMVKSIPLATLPLAHPQANQANLAGIDYYQRGEWEKALVKFQEALQIDDDFPEAHFNAALTLHQLKRHQEATYHFQRAGELAPDREAVVKSSLYRNHLGLSSIFERHLSGGYGYP
ncbi:MAG: tetratricopeptide repeat protein [Nitrospirales bacterium]|nr:tetratricopeptide repeat protein [Nitrospirales bacterium]